MDCTANIHTAVWKPLFQHHDGRYRRGGKASKQWKPVMDEVEIQGEGDFPYIRHHRLKLTGNGALAAASKRQLRKAGLQHHILGKSFP